MRVLDDTDKEILRISRKLFIEYGIINTEMKDIAKKLGRSRSTLYRHFSDKNEILMLLAEGATSMIRNAIKIPDGVRFICGFDEFSWQMDSLVNVLTTNVDQVMFLRDFDCLYTKEYPDIPETETFLEGISQARANNLIKRSVERGIEDGSIVSIENPELFSLAMVHGTIAMAQRILPREKIYIQEYGYGQEILRCHVKFILGQIKNKS